MSLHKMDEKETEYNEWHSTLGRAQSTDYVLDRPWYRTAKRLLPDLNGKKCLEIGCGRGEFSIYLATTYPGATIIGTDFSSAAIDIAREKMPSNLTNLSYQVENAEQLTFKDNEFDFVISCETMEHVFHPQLMSNEMYRVLKPGGQFLLTTENYFNGMILAWIKSWITKKPFESGSGIQPHENFFVYYKVGGFFKKSGFTLDKTESNHFQWLLLPGVAPGKLCTEDFKSPVLKNLFKPFGRHYCYTGHK